MNDDYSKREIDHMFADITNKLEQILTQTTKTNGRVNSLEKWRWVTTGAMAVITGCLLPILGWALYQVVTFQERVEQSVLTALESYNPDK